MTDVGNVPGADGSQLRERPSAKPMHMRDPDAAKQKVLELNEQEDAKGEREKKTYGRTPDGTGKYQPCLSNSKALSIVAQRTGRP